MDLRDIFSVFMDFSWPKFLHSSIQFHSEGALRFPPFCKHYPPQQIYVFGAGNLPLLDMCVLCVLGAPSHSFWQSTSTSLECSTSTQHFFPSEWDQELKTIPLISIIWRFLGEIKLFFPHSLADSTAWWCGVEYARRRCGRSKENLENFPTSALHKVYVPHRIILLAPSHASFCWICRIRH